MNKKTPALILFIALLFISSAKAQFGAVSASYDVTNYVAQIEPEMANKSVKGKVKVQFNLLANNLGEIQLNIGVLEIDAVRENKTALKFETKDSLLNINLSRPAKLNEKTRD